ncbi:MAG: FGGY-family carbohydrate kinase, partial [Rhodopseudomonas palustris]|nr:FGGY-family carbohydrate kinase [Rhodopseudomonas palustris]
TRFQLRIAKVNTKNTDNFLQHLIGPSSEVYGTLGVRAPDGIPVAGHGRRPAGRPLRPGLLPPRRVEVHLRHRRLPAREHRQRSRSLSRSGLLTTVAWQVGGSRPATPWKGARSSPAPRCSGCATAWAWCTAAAEIEALARQVPDSGGVVFVPALAGLGAPHWNSGARGLISGITRGTTAAHLARATLEGIALQIRRPVPRPWPPTRGSRWRSSRSTAAPPGTTCSCSCRPTCWTSRSPGRRPSRPRPSARPMLAGLAVGFWRDAGRAGRKLAARSSASPRRRGQSGGRNCWGGGVKR